MENKKGEDKSFFYMNLKINEKINKENWEQNIPYPDEGYNAISKTPIKQEKYIYFEDLPFGTNYWTQWVESMPSEH